jgi:hypothetical protein
MTSGTTVCPAESLVRLNSPSRLLKTPNRVTDFISIGSAAFVGLGVYSYYTGMSNLRKREQAIMQGSTKYKMGSRRLGIATISASLIGLGVWRAFN